MNWKSRFGQMRDVADVAGQQVVDADHRVAAIEQRLREVRADEPGGAGDDNAFFIRSSMAESDAVRSQLSAFSPQ